MSLGFVSEGWRLMTWLFLCLVSLKQVKMTRGQKDTKLKVAPTNVDLNYPG